jgi:hypothetical protein
MKKYTFKINGALVSVFATNIYSAELLLPPVPTPKLFSITPRRPMNGIIWR